MPSVSRKQQRLFGLALSIKRGETPMNVSKAAARIARTQSSKTIKEFAGTINPAKALKT